MFQWLKRKLAAPWSVYVVRNENQLIALAISDRVVASLGNLLPFFERFGNPREPYRIALNFNPTHTVVWVDESSFVDGGLEKSFMKRLEEIDPKFLTRTGEAGVSLQFVDPTTKQEIDRFELFCLLWPDSA